MHEVIRSRSMDATAAMKRGEPCDLLRYLADDPDFPLCADEIAAEMIPSAFVGRAPQQVAEYIASIELAADDAVMEDVEL